MYAYTIHTSPLIQAHSYNGESLLNQDKCGEAIRGLKESVDCKFFSLFYYLL